MHAECECKVKHLQNGDGEITTIKLPSLRSLVEAKIKYWNKNLMQLDSITLKNLMSPKLYMLDLCSHKRNGVGENQCFLLLSFSVSLGSLGALTSCFVSGSEQRPSLC